VSRGGGSEAVSFSVTSSLTSSRPQQSDVLAQQKIEFDRRLAKLNEWLDQTESTLELVTIEMSNSNDILTVEEQLVLIEVFIIWYLIKYLYIIQFDFIPSGDFNVK